jgi:peroxiredoxin 2/4
MKRLTVAIHTIVCSILIWNLAGACPVLAKESDDTVNSAKLQMPEPPYDQVTAMVGEPAPNFTLDAVEGGEFRKLSLSDFRGKWVVLFFYPLDFTFVCPTEIRGFNKEVQAFNKLNAVVLGASVDSKYSHLAWIKSGALGDLKYPLLSDIKREAAKRYGILDNKEGVALRGLFIIDPDGILQYELVHNLSVGRSVEEILRVLEALQTGELCPLGWHSGEKTLGK